MPLKSVRNPVASNLKNSSPKDVGSNDDNIASIEIIDLTSEQVESNTQFPLNTRENDRRYILHGEEEARA